MKAKFQIVFFLTVLLSINTLAQTMVKGRITEATDPSLGVAFVNVVLKGTTMGGTTDIDGYYSIEATPGTYTLFASFVGYTDYNKAGVVVREGETTTVNFKMSESAMELGAIELTETIERESEESIMIEQKNATEIVQAIGAQELSRKGVSDVAAAVTKVTGISKQEGKSGVFVRGLGDRYNSTSLNNLPLPSNNPSRKNISLGLFNTDIVQVIGINKIFNADIFGDVGGANINIKSKVHSGDPYLNLSIGASANTNALSADEFYVQDGPGKLGYYNPGIKESYLDADGLPSSWDYNKSNLPLGYNFAINGGRSFDLSDEIKLDFFGTASQESKFSMQEGIARGGVDASGNANSDFTYESHKINSNTTAMANVNLDLNTLHSIKLNSLYINSAGQDVSNYRGVISDRDIIAENGGGLIRRQDYDKTTLFVNQLLGDFTLTDNIDLHVGTAYNIVDNIIPDRKYNMFVPIDDKNPNGPKKSNDFAPAENHRFFQDLKERELAGDAYAKYKFTDLDEDGDDIEKGSITLGGTFRRKNVDFAVTQFNMSVFKNNSLVQQTEVDPNNVDKYFSADNYGKIYQTETFRGGKGSSRALDPQTYTGLQQIFSGYAKGQYNLNDALSVTLGARFDNVYQSIRWNTAISKSDASVILKKNAFLPSASAKYSLNETDNLKLGVSKSYTLPQYKERARFQFEDVTTIYVGNEDLYASDNYNADIRWESFPKPGTMYSATVYGKLIQNPINEVVLASATNDISYINTGKQATVAGIEAEFKQDIIDFRKDEESELTHNIALNTNVSWMFHSNQDFDKDKVVRETNYSVFFTETEGGITGASDLLANADILYLNELSENKSIQANVSLAYFSDRIAAIGTANKGDFVDKGFLTVNLGAKMQVNENLKLSLSLKNICNPNITRIQKGSSIKNPTTGVITTSEDVEILKYKVGANIGFGITYSF
jgi:outer membrane receptor protein involved in Fe transport